MSPFFLFARYIVRTEVIPVSQIFLGLFLLCYVFADSCSWDLVSILTCLFLTESCSFPVDNYLGRILCVLGWNCVPLERIVHCCQVARALTDQGHFKLNSLLETFWTSWWYKFEQQLPVGRRVNFWFALSLKMWPLWILPLRGKGFLLKGLWHFQGNDELSSGTILCFPSSIFMVVFVSLILYILLLKSLLFALFSLGLVIQD